MNKNHFVSICLSAAVLLSACKKEKSGDDPSTSPSSNKELTILKSSEWKVLAKQSLQELESVHGGRRGTVSFTTQKPDELRWYTSHATAVNTSNHNELILNIRGEVTINKDLKSPSYGGAIKGFAGNDVWKINMGESASQVYAFKNDQMVDLAKNREGQMKYVRLQPATDGFLNNSETLGNNYVTHFEYASQKWKNNTFWGNNFISLRHNGKTYAIAFTRFTSANGMTIMMESDNRVVVQDPQIPSIQTVHYPMNTLKSVPGEYGVAIQASKYGDNVFVIFHSHTASNRYGVVKVNLSSLTVQTVQTPEHVVPPVNAASLILDNASLLEVDEAGNLYVVEIRSENMNAIYSIRKYAANGGNEVILKEQDLHPNTQIQGLKWFNGKLHAALINREDIPDGNPNDNSFKMMYHQQLISTK
ncbi:hypothetical protein [Pedobacter flavus]|uniref:Lipoprotein n=1 Tax=Pedobacter flavus TaxID=3113906 RepID=A0ABU7GYX1_9SPHI|nr:hypothetical protein [Pedobacter sp. VNH31]MEE1884208.1 hypothetical protein [Pedobacter sp. VNH31]